MKFFRKKDEVRTEGEKMPATLEADCLGSDCPNWQDKVCDSGFEWISASATVVENRDTSEPPFIDETKHIIYGQFCTALAERKLVAQRVEVLQTPKGGMMELIAITGAYGEMPVQINHAGESGSIVTIANTRNSES